MVNAWNPQRSCSGIAALFVARCMEAWLQHCQDNITRAVQS